MSMRVRFLLAIFLAGLICASASNAAIAFRAAANAGVNSTSSLTINLPAGTAANDVLIASIAVRPVGTTIGTPSGWTRIRNTAQSNDVSMNLATFYRVATGSEAASFTWTFSGSSHTGAVGGIASFSGVDTSDPISVESGNTTSYGFTHRAVQITTTLTNSMLVSSHAFTSATSGWTPPSGMTEAVDAASQARPDPVGMSLEMNYQAQASAAATGNKDAVAASSGTDAGNGAAHLLALKPSVLPTPIAEWRMDQAAWSGAVGEVIDSSGAYHATRGGPANTASVSPAYTSGGQSTCNYGRFDQSGSPRAYVQLPAGFPGASANFTISAWMRTTDIGKTGQRIFVNDDNGNGWALSLSDEVAGTLRLFNRNIAYTSASGGGAIRSSNVALDTPVVFSNNTWYFVAASVDTAGRNATLYVYNTTGTQLAKTSASYTGTWVAGSGATSIGNETAASAENDLYFKGNLDEVRAFASALSQADIEYYRTRVRTCAAASTAPAAFNAVEVGANAVSGQIGTKTAGAAFSLDIYALNAARTAHDTAAGGDVLIDLLANTVTGVALDANNCPTSATTLSIGTVTLTAGKATAAMGTVANSWRDVRVRMRYPATGVASLTACSADNFAVKPATLVASASHADWQTAGSTTAMANTGASGGAIHKAGRPFTLRATAYNAGNVITSNYDGSPAAGATCVLPAGACVAGALSAGAFSAGGGTVASATASYSEVGAISATLTDTAYAGVDSDDSAASCAGYFVCADAINIGRFVPNHFDLAVNTAAFTPACGGFTYLGQPFAFGAAPIWTVTARNSGGATTLNYTGALFKLAAGTITGQAWSAASGVVGAVGGLPAVGVADIGGGQGRLTFGVGSPPGGGLMFARAAVAAPFNASLTLAASVADSEGVAHAGNPYQHSGIGFDDGNAATGADAEMRFGRLRIANAHGSELLALPVSLTTQFWNGAGFVTNTLDNCTSLAAPTLTFHAQGANNQLAGGETGATYNTPFAAGGGGLRLSAPGVGNFGYLDVGITAPDWLKYNWDGVDQGGDGNLFDDSPRARAAFGKRKGSDKVIIRREIY